MSGLCQEDEKSSCCTKDEGGPFKSRFPDASDHPETGEITERETSGHDKRKGFSDERSRALKICNSSNCCSLLFVCQWNFDGRTKRLAATPVVDRDAAGGSRP
jgi:hypothetical protein